MKKGQGTDHAYTALVETKLAAIWAHALSAPWGCAVQTSDRDALKRQLYLFRRKRRDGGDTSLDHLKITTGPEKDSQELWIFSGEEPK